MDPPEGVANAIQWLQEAALPADRVALRPGETLVDPERYRAALLHRLQHATGEGLSRALDDARALRQALRPDTALPPATSEVDEP